MEGVNSVFIRENSNMEIYLEEDPLDLIHESPILYNSLQEQKGSNLTTNPVHEHRSELGGPIDNLQNNILQTAIIEEVTSDKTNLNSYSTLINIKLKIEPEYELHSDVLIKQEDGLNCNEKFSMNSNGNKQARSGNTIPQVGQYPTCSVPFYGESDTNIVKCTDANNVVKVEEDENVFITIEDNRNRKSELLKCTGTANIINCIDADNNTHLNECNKIKLEPVSIHEDNNINSSCEFKEEDLLHQNEMFYCDICFIMFNSKSKLLVHMKTHGKYICMCEETFNKIGLYKQHLKIHIRPFRCEICNRSFKSDELLNKHILKVHSIICVICNNAFKTKWLLKEHKRIHAKNKSYKCSKCEKKFREEEHLIRHEMLHTGIKCDKCEDSFRTEKQLLLHFKDKHNISYNCDKCEKWFIYANDLKRHEKFHTRLRPYECHACGKNFVSKANLTLHSRIHRLKDSVITERK